MARTRWGWEARDGGDDVGVNRRRCGRHIEEATERTETCPHSLKQVSNRNKSKHTDRCCARVQHEYETIKSSVSARTASTMLKYTEQLYAYVTSTSCSTDRGGLHWIIEASERDASCHAVSCYSKSHASHR